VRAGLETSTGAGPARSGGSADIDTVADAVPASVDVVTGAGDTAGAVEV
jgi:hypothetical protein